MRCHTRAILCRVVTYTASHQRTPSAAIANTQALDATEVWILKIPVRY